MVGATLAGIDHTDWVFEITVSSRLTFFRKLDFYNPPPFHIFEVIQSRRSLFTIVDGDSAAHLLQIWDQKCNGLRHGILFELGAGLIV